MKQKMIGIFVNGKFILISILDEIQNELKADRAREKEDTIGEEVPVFYIYLFIILNQMIV